MHYNEVLAYRTTIWTVEIGNHIIYSEHINSIWRVWEKYVQNKHYDWILKASRIVPLYSIR